MHPPGQSPAPNALHGLLSLHQSPSCGALLENPHTLQMVPLYTYGHQCHLGSCYGQAAPLCFPGSLSLPFSCLMIDPLLEGCDGVYSRPDWLLFVMRRLFQTISTVLKSLVLVAAPLLSPTSQLHHQLQWAVAPPASRRKLELSHVDPLDFPPHLRIHLASRLLPFSFLPPIKEASSLVPKYIPRPGLNALLRDNS